ncbi:hypothetical protein [Aquipuribacter sp. MA13-6]|uniref:hypothetical protein n=1 Tax=unclassified Aquipuribacter TaxID=2635084 RepID=UPI003EEA7607
MTGRPGLPLISLGGGALALVAGVVAVLVGVVLLGADQASEPVALPVGEVVPVPATQPFNLAPVVVHGADPQVDGSLTEAMGCVVVSAGGRDGARLAVRPPGETVVELDGVGELEPLVATTDFADGDSVRCDGPGAERAQPLALSIGSTGARGAAVAMLVLGVFAVVVGLALVGVGAVLRRGTASGRGARP